MLPLRKWISSSRSAGYIGMLVIFIVALAVIFTGELFSLFVGEQTPGQYDPNVQYVPTPLPQQQAKDTLQMVAQTYGTVNLGGGGGAPDGPGRCKLTNPPFVPTDFPSLYPLASPVFNEERDLIDVMTGQGRCVPWQTDTEFADFVINNDNKAHGYLHGLVGLRANLMKIYDKATHSDSGRLVNPVVLVTIWGSETSFGRFGDQEAFGCDYWGFGFDPQLNCIVNNVFDRWMNHFEIQQKKDPYNYCADPFFGSAPWCVNKCLYEDPLVFTFERHNPKCKELIGDAHWTNVVNFYNDFVYAK